MTDKSAIVRTLYEAFGCGDVRTILVALDPSTDWTFATHDPSVPWRGKRPTIEGAAAFFDALANHLAFRAFQPRQFLAAPDSVIVLGRTPADAKSTGKTCDKAWVHVFTFQGDRLERFQEFYETTAIAAAFAA